MARLLPDLTRWTFDINRTGEGALSDMFANSCVKRYNANAPATDTEISTITAPSGLVGTFVMRHRWHARSYAFSACILDKESIPPLSENLSIVQRTLAGPGLALQTWNYAYSPAQASTNSDACAATQTCPDTSYVDVTGPDNARTRYTHHTRDGVLEGKLMKTEIFETDGTLLRTDVVQYPVLASLPFQAHLGDSMRGTRSNLTRLEYRYPTLGGDIIQQGRKFQWYVPTTCGTNQYCFDGFGRATKTVKKSQPAP